MRKYLICSIAAISYLLIVFLLGFGIRDDFFMLAFPSWPFLIGCFENCGHRLIITATILNGIFLGLIVLGALFIIENIRKK
jgi:hypothetical protein